MRKYFYRGESLSILLQTPVPETGERVRISDYEVTATVQGMAPSMEVISDYEVRLFLSSKATALLELGRADLILQMQSEDLVIIGKNIDLFVKDPIDSRPIDGADEDNQMILTMNTGDIVFTMSLEHVSRSALKVWRDNVNPNGTEEEYLVWLREPANEAAILVNEKAILAEEKATLANEAAISANESATLAQEKALEANTATTNAIAAKDAALAAASMAYQETASATQVIGQMQTLASSVNILANELSIIGNEVEEKGNDAASKAALANNAATEALTKGNNAQTAASLANTARDGLLESKVATELATIAANNAKENANQSSLLAQQKAELAKINAELAKSEALKAATASLTANNAAIRAESSADDADEATRLANIAASSALENAALANEKAGLANSAAILAGQRAGEAEVAAQAANETAQHPTYIGADHYVYTWNPNTKAYGKTDTYCKGDAFSVSKVYASVAAMNADFAGLDTKVGDFVLIETGNVEDPDNSKLYVKTSTEWAYLTDLSGAIGFTGKTPQLSIGAVTTGAAGSSAQVSISENGVDASGNPKFNLNFAIPQGAKGDTGNKGETGETGKSAFQDYYDNTTDNPKLSQAEWNTLHGQMPAKEQERQLNEQGRISNENSRLSTYENLEQAAAAALNEMAGRVEALERILREYKLTSADIDTLNYKTMTKEGCPLYYESDSAPTIVPDFVGQKFYKTTSPYAVYEAVGVASVSNWVLL